MDYLRFSSEIFNMPFLTSSLAFLFSFWVIFLFDCIFLFLIFIPLFLINIFYFELWLKKKTFEGGAITVRRPVEIFFNISKSYEQIYF